MFKKLPDQSEKVMIHFEGKSLETTKGQTVAAALLSNGVIQFRESVVSAQPRSPYCLMGVCFECLVEINGKPNHQSCMILVENGMKIKKQQRPSVDQNGNT